MEHFLAFLMALFFKVLFVVVVVVLLVLLVKKINGNNSGANRNYRTLTRSQNNRYIAGVCGGIAEYFGWDATVVRVIFVLLGGFGMAIPYIVLVVILPVSRVR